MKVLLFILLFFIILVMVVGFGIIRTVFKLFFGGNRRSAYYERETKETETQRHNGNKKEKLFSKEEGEYIDFEEIKDDKDKKN